MSAIYYQKVKASTTFSETFSDFKTKFCEKNDENLFKESSYYVIKYIPKLVIKKECLKDAFWFVYSYVDRLDQLYRAICTILYYSGIVFFSSVVIQNIWFVISNSFAK